MGISDEVTELNQPMWFGSWRPRTIVAATQRGGGPLLKLELARSESIGCWWNSRL